MIVLASSSPQRAKILSEAGLTFAVRPPLFEEVLDPSLSPTENAKMLALGKAKSIQEFFPDEWILGVDTIVVCKNEIIGKPKTKEEAREILRKLQNSTHSVISGIALVRNEKTLADSEETQITFGAMDEKDMESFLQTDEWKNRSGAFTIEKHGALYIQKIDGDYYNVVGLPLFKIRMMLKQVSITLR